jgi:hypothetical protein
VAVRVVGAHGHQGHPGARRGEELRIGVGAAVVGHLEHVGGQVDAVPDEAVLRLCTEVTGQEHPEAPDRHPDDQGQIVRFRTRHRPPGARRQHIHLDRTDAHPVAGLEHRSGAGRLPQDGVEGRGAVVVRRQRTGRDEIDVPAGERAGQAAHVVGVQMAEEHERELVDAEPVQAAVDRTDLGAGVHEHAGAGRRGDDQRVPLPDVAGDEDRVGGRPATGDLPQRPAHGDDGHQGDQGDETDARGAPQQRGRQYEEHTQRQSPHGAGRPGDSGVGQPGRALGHEHQPAHRPPRQPHEDIGRRRGQRREDRGAETEHGRHGHGRCRQQVGRDRHQAHRAVEAGDEGRRRHARGRTDRQRIRDRRRPAPLPQPPRPPRREEDDRRGRPDRQSEPGVRGQVGLQQEQRDRGRREGRHSGAGSAGGQCPERDPSHGSRAHHAGRRAGEDDESDQPQQTHDDLHTAVDGATAQRPQHRGQHDRHVGAGHGCEMGEPRRLEVLLQHGVRPARVADDKSGQETGRPRCQHPGGRPGQPGAHRSGGRLPPDRGRHGGRRATGRHHGDHRVPGSRRRHRDPGTHALPREQLAPALDGGEQQHRRPDVTHAVCLDEGDHRRVRQASRQSAAAEEPQVAVQLEDGVDGSAHDVRCPQRRDLALPAVHGAGTARYRRPRQDGHHDRADRSPSPPRDAGGEGEAGDARDPERPRREPGSDRRDGPHGSCHRHKSQIQPRQPAPSPDEAEPGAAHTATASARCSRIAGPIPATSSRSSTCRKGPCCSRWSTIR